MEDIEFVKGHLLPFLTLWIKILLWLRYDLSVYSNISCSETLVMRTFKWWGQCNTVIVLETLTLAKINAVLHKSKLLWSKGLPLATSASQDYTQAYSIRHPAMEPEGPHLLFVFRKYLENELPYFPYPLSVSFTLESRAPPPGKIGQSLFTVYFRWQWPSMLATLWRSLYTWHVNFTNQTTTYLGYIGIVLRPGRAMQLSIEGTVRINFYYVFITF